MIVICSVGGTGAIRLAEKSNTSYVAERQGGGRQNLLRWFESTRSYFESILVQSRS
jgi:hypothetical protein